MHGGGESTAQYTHNDERHGTAPTTHGRTDDERARREQGEGGHTQHEEKHNNTARDATTNDDEDSTATRARLHSLVTFGPTRACMGGTRTGDVLTVHSNLPVLLTKTSPRSSQRKGHERNTTRDETRRDSHTVHFKFENHATAVGTPTRRGSKRRPRANTANHSLYRTSMPAARGQATRYPEGHFAREPATDGSIGLSPLCTSCTIDLHVRTA